MCGCSLKTREKKKKSGDRWGRGGDRCACYMCLSTGQFALSFYFFLAHKTKNIFQEGKEMVVVQRDM